MAKEADRTMTLGPFSGGLNLQSDPTDVGDKECVEALNFDLDPNGSLRSRPPFTAAANPATDAQLPLGLSGNAKLLGYYYDNSGSAVLLASDGLSSTYLFDGASWVLVTNTFAATAMAQFDGKAWLVAPYLEDDPGGYWTPAGGFVADANMPKGSDIAVYKDRMWVASGRGSTSPTSMFYSKLIPEGSIWATAAAREVQVSPGDGQIIVAIRSYYGALLVFRSQSIYSYSYATSTAAATISVIAPGVGLTNRECLVTHESYLYFMYDGKAYEYVNNRAQQINQQVPFRGSNLSGISAPFAVSTLGRRVLFAYYDYLYAFNLDLRKWTRWTSQTWGAIGQVLEAIPGTAIADALALPSGDVPLGGTRKVQLLQISDALTASEKEPFICSMQTKNYSFESPSVMKRMWHWGVDAVFRDKVSGTAHPVTQTQSTDWGALWSSGVTWADLLSSTWASPVTSDVVTEVATEYDLAGVGFDRKYVKFRKAMRFRQVYFRVDFEADGSIATSPVYLFTLRLKVATRQLVSKAIS